MVRVSQAASRAPRLFFFRSFRSHFSIFFVVPPPLAGGDVYALKLEIALFYIDIEPLSQLLVPISHLHTSRQKIPRQTQISIRNRAGLGVISGEVDDKSAVRGFGFNSGTRVARVPIPRALTLLETPESTTHLGLPSPLPSNNHRELVNYRGKLCSRQVRKRSVPRYFTELTERTSNEDQCLGLVRSLGLAESHSVNLMRDGRFRLKTHAR